MLKLFTYHNLSKLRREWIELYNSNPNLSPFVEYDYFKRTIKYFWYYFFAKRCHIKYYLIRHNDSPILIAPILFFSNGKKELFANINGYNYCDFIYKNCSETNDAIKLLYDNIGMFDIYKIRENSTLIKNIPYSSYSVVQISNVRIDFSQNYDQYYHTLSKSVRQNLRTSYNRLNRAKCSFKLKIVCGGKKDNSFFNDVINLYCKRHEKKYNVKHSFIKQYLLKHHHFATENYKKSANAITFGLYIDGKLASFMSGIVSMQNEFIVPRLSINDDLLFYSPGMILINEVIKYLINNTEINVLDLSQGEEEYKYKMGGSQHLTYTFISKK